MKIQLADKIIEVHNLFPLVEKQCEKYRVSETVPADFQVAIDERDVLFERERSQQAREAKDPSLEPFSMEYLETLAVYRKISEILPFYDTMLFHASALAMDGKAYLFTAKSGTGKSTHASLWRQAFGERVTMINDDKPLLRVTKAETYVCGTPWSGKHGLDTNVTVPVSAIVLLERGAINEARPISASEAFPMLLQQTYRPYDASAMQKTLLLLNQLQNNVRFFRLHCNADAEAAIVSHQALLNVSR